MHIHKCDQSSFNKVSSCNTSYNTYTCSPPFSSILTHYFFCLAITLGHNFPETLCSGRGSGLGLVLAKEIISMHGGSVIVESEEGVGSAFGFRIPFELASLDVEVKPVEITHTNVRYLNFSSFVLIPLGNALSFTTDPHYFDSII